MDRLGVGWLAIPAQTEVVGRLRELTVHAHPLPDPQVVEVVLATPSPELVARPPSLLAAEVVPQLHPSEEVRSGNREPGMGQVGL